MKSGTWKVGEQKLAVHLGVDWWTLGDGFTWESTDLDESAAKNIHAWGVAKEKLASGEYDLLVLDELTYVINYGWVSAGEVVEGIVGRAPKTNVVITGRDAPPELVEIADTVTEMRMVKHAYRTRRAGDEGHRVLTLGSELYTFGGEPALAAPVWRPALPVACRVDRVGRRRHRLRAMGPQRAGPGGTPGSTWRPTSARWRRRSDCVDLASAC